MDFDLKKLVLIFIYVRKMKYSIVVLLIAILFSCNNRDIRIAPWGLPENGNIIARQEVVGEDTIIICSLDEVSKSLTIKVSDLVDSLELIKLENTEDALVGEGDVFLSDNYIGVKSNVYKLFNKKGVYINTIGNIGQGPGEYNNLYDSQIDEVSDRIYLLEMNAKSILSYDLKGNYIQSIPLAYRLPKGRIYIETASERVTITAMPWQGEEIPLLWIQDFEGNVITETRRDNVAVFPEFSSEVFSGMPEYRDNFSLFVTSITGRIDTLYHYSLADNKLSSRFTVEYPNKEKIPLHYYCELPHCYIVEIYEKEIKGLDFTAFPQTRIIVDKKTLRGGYFDLLLDPLGGLFYKSYVTSFRDGYFILNIDPGNLKDLVDESKSFYELLSETDIQKLKDLKKSISEDDNNYR